MTCPKAHRPWRAWCSAPPPRPRSSMTTRAVSSPSCTAPSIASSCRARSLPKILKEATIAVEDKRFYSDFHGIDLRSHRARRARRSQGGPRRAGRQHDHRAVRQERLPGRLRRQPHAEAPRGDPRLGAQRPLVQGPDPHRLPEHRLLWRRRLRRAGRGPHLLPRKRRAAHAGPGRPARRPAPGPERLLADLRPTGGHGPAQRGACRHGRPGLHHSGPGAPRRPKSRLRVYRSVPPGVLPAAAYFVDYVEAQLVAPLRRNRDLRGRPARLHHPRPAHAARRSRGDEGDPAGRAGRRFGLDRPGQRLHPRHDDHTRPAHRAVRPRLPGPPPARLGDEALRPGGGGRAGREPGHHLLHLDALEHPPARSARSGTSRPSRTPTPARSTSCRRPGSPTTRSTPSSPWTWGRPTSCASPMPPASPAP